MKKSTPILHARKTSHLTVQTENSPLLTTPIASPPHTSTAATRKLKFIVGLKPLSECSSTTFKTSTGGFFNSASPSSIPSPTFSGKPIRLTKYKHGAMRRSFQILNGINPLDQAEIDEAKEIRKTLMEQDDQEKVVSEDALPQDVVGAGAVKSFYVHYKKLSKVKDTNTFTQTQDATYTSFLSKTENLNLLPTRLGFIREAGQPDKVQLNHFRIGDKYAEVLSEGLKSVKGFSKLELANNRLTPAGANHILSKLTPKTELINLSCNEIGKLGCNHLCNIISSQNSQLLELNLEGNKLGDVALGQLCEAINYNSSLKKLNLGKNFLTVKSADKLCRMLEMNTTIEELYLQWNQLKGPGGATVVNGLKSATQLRVLDLSWNSLGLTGTVFAKAFGAYIASNTTLVHLDLSNNYINKADSKIIAEDLKNNHSLYGIHYQGNTGYINSKGFLMIPDEWDPKVNERMIHPPLNGIKYNPESLKHHLGNNGEYKDVCWICEGWRVAEFGWGVNSGTGGDEDPVYIHISHEGYKNLFLPSKNEFKNIRMVPPNAFNYFFSIDGCQVHALDQPFERSRELVYEMEMNHEKKLVRVENVNFGCKSSLRRVLDENYEPVYELKTFDIKPRVVDEEYVPPENAYERQQWKLPCSIFRNSKPDSQALIEDCFRVDFEGTRISKLIKSADDLLAVREILHSSYKQLKDCYKYYASIGAPSDIWCIPLNTYTDFCNSCGLIDGKVLKLSDFDRIFIATYTKQDKERNPRNPDRAIVRYQFLEGLVRIAEQKYLGSGQVQTFAEALTILMEENVKPFIAKFDHQKWGPEKFWNENVDVVLKSYLPVIRGVFRKYSGQKTVPGQKKFMCIEEFNKLMNDGDMFSENYGDRDAVLAFNLSMTTQLDELNSDRIYQMNFTEFLEAFARAVDKIAPGPYSNNSQPPQSNESRSGSSYEIRYAQPLHIKLEGMMPLLWSLCGSDVKDVWVLPETSIFEMEEVNPKVRYATKKKKIVRINPTLLSSIEPYEGVNALQI